MSVEFIDRDFGAISLSPCVNANNLSYVPLAETRALRMLWRFPGWGLTDLPVIDRFVLERTIRSLSYLCPFVLIPGERLALPTLLVNSVRSTQQLASDQDI